MILPTYFCYKSDFDLGVHEDILLGTPCLLVGSVSKVLSLTLFFIGFSGGQCDLGKSLQILPGSFRIGRIVWL